MPRLKPTEIERFRDDGILVPERPLLAPERFAALRRCFEDCLADWQQRFRQRPEQMDKPHFLYPELFDYALDPGVLDLVEDLIGPDLVLFTTHFICKPPGTGQRVPWHEDSAYWTGMLEPMEDVLTIWLAIDPSTTENGCLRVVPGSHLRPDGHYQQVSDRDESVFATELDPRSIDDNEVRDVILEPGQCSVHHARMIHGSLPNRGDLRRCGFTVRFFSSHCRFLHHELEPDFAIYLARGRDHAGNRYAEPGQINTQWQDRHLTKIG